MMLSKFLVFVPVLCVGPSVHANDVSWDDKARYILARVSEGVLEDDLILLFGEEHGSWLFEEWEEIRAEMEEVEFRPSPSVFERFPVEQEDEFRESYLQDSGNVPTPDEAEFFSRSPYVDSYIQHLYDTLDDPDCMEGEVDVQAPDFSVDRAAQIWHKCRLLILRNAIDAQQIEFIRQNVTQFVYDLKDQKVNAFGRTSYSDPYYVYDVAFTRWDLLLPKSLVSPDVVTNPTLMALLSDERVLGEQFKLMSYGMVMSEPDAESQQWHQDSSFIYGNTDSLSSNGVAGMEFPTSQITLMAPLLNITGQHGPTEFCMGSRALSGTNYYQDLDQWRNQTLKKEFHGYDMALHRDAGFIDDWCPRRMWRSAEINIGDIVLWDFDLTHRAGLNNSTDFRTALYGAFARDQVQDRNFFSRELRYDGYPSFLWNAELMGRFAMPKNATPCHWQEDSCARPWSEMSFIQEIRGA